MTNEEKIRLAIKTLTLPEGGVISPYRIRAWLLDNVGYPVPSTAEISACLALPHDEKAAEGDMMEKRV